jgi:oligoribonuclease NrnB/cAMP/cGMP phosphodiesterase (DHH superfamily)
MADPKTIPLVLYHAGCPDGFGAAWAIHTVQPNTEFMAVSYEKPPPDVTGRDVTLVDFSYKRAAMMKLAEQAQNILVLDHHKSAEKELEGLSFCIFDMKHSGARLAWDYFVQKAPPHWLIDYVEDRDLWNWQLANSHEISEAIACYPKTFEAWDELAQADFGELIKQGEAIMRYKNEMIRIMVGGATDKEIGGFTVPTVNCSLKDMASDVGHVLAEGKPFSATWHESQGKRYWGLRSTDEGEDVSVIAEKFGGGGHRNASGFEEDAYVPSDEGDRTK